MSTEINTKIEDLTSRLQDTKDKQRFMKLLSNLSQLAAMVASSHHEPSEVDKTRKDYFSISQAYQKAIDLIKTLPELSELRDILGPLETSAKTYINISEKKIVEKYIERSDELQALGLHEEATSPLDELLTIVSDAYKPDILVKKGNLLSRLHKFNEALKLYDQALLLDPKNSNAYIYKGFLLHTLGKFNEASKLYDQALLLDPKNASNALLLSSKGLALDALGRAEEAELYYDNALSVNQNDSFSWYNKASSLHRRKRFTEAVECYKKSLALSATPSDEVKAHLAEVFLLSNRSSESEVIAREVCQESSDYILGFAMRLLIVCSSYLQNIESKEESVHDLLRYYDSIPLDLSVGWHFDNLKDFLQHTNNLDPDDLQLLLNLTSLSKVTSKAERDQIMRSIKDMLDKKKKPISTLEQIRGDFENRNLTESQIKITNTFKQDISKQGWFDWDIFIDAPDDIINTIDSVTYRLHPTFRDRIRTVREKKDNFKLHGRGWGEFSVEVDIQLSNGNKIKKYHWLKLGETPLDY
jgi:tetratricopeptide (TPR) repeat protein